MLKGFTFLHIQRNLFIALENNIFRDLCSHLLGDKQNYVGSSVKLIDKLLDYMQPAYFTKQSNRPILRAIEKS
jgi:hypothetical protein